MVIDNTQTPTQLVQDVLLGQGVVVSNISFSGQQQQIGYFDASNANFSIPEGICLSTGDVTEIPGPGNYFSSSDADNQAGPSDVDIDVILSVAVHDAVSLEFDFVPTGDSIRFNYVFASEEYPEFVNAGFNDAFAFIISGPGFNGPFSNNGENIALLPDGVTPVTIDNVNAGLNSQYYIDNNNGVDPNGVVYDGYTVTLTALAEVQCGETYHLKFVVADGGDNAWDTGVFLEARSFNSNAIEVDITTLSGDSAIVEGCTSATIDFTRPDADSLLLVPVYTSGNAIAGVDYAGLPDTITFNPGDTTITITVEALEDGVFEPIRDTLIITVYSLNLCGDTVVSTGVIYIQEDYNLTIATQDVSVLCPADSVMLIASAGAGNPDYTYTWSNGDVGDTIYVPVTSTMSYTVVAEDICAATSLVDTVEVFVDIPPDPQVTISGPTTFDCVPETVMLTASASGGTTPYVYVWSNGTVGQNNSVTLNADATYYVSVQDGCGVISEPDTIHITQNPVAVPQIQTSLDVVLDCPGETATLTAIASGGNAPYQYSWSSGQVTSTINVQPTETTDYVITVTDACYVGQVRDTITVTVVPYTEPTVFVSDTVVSCFGDLATLTAVTDGGSSPFTYNWSNGEQGISTTISVSSSVADYIVSVTDACGFTVTDTAVVACSYDPEWFVELSSYDLLYGDTVVICELWSDTVSASVFGGGHPPFTYTWSGTLIEGVDINNDTVVLNVNYELPPDSSVIETYSVSVVDYCNVETVVEFPVTVISCDVVQPNVINPESDYQGGTDFCGSVPQNNVFNLPCLELYPGNTMTIWDRWGRKCYQTDDYHLNPWDGGNQSSGTYYYVCELPGDKEPVKGYFQLLR